MFGSSENIEKRPRVAEFFAGIGLVRMGLERAGFDVIWANDIEQSKKDMYKLNFDAEHYVVEDITKIKGDNVPAVDLATASFPCTDFSLAGNMAGLAGEQSGLFWDFARILEEMGSRRPSSIMIENVPSFATSHGGQDIKDALKELNRIGYWCDILQINAKHFTAQSRPRLFIIGSQKRLDSPSIWNPSTIRPKWVQNFASIHTDLNMHSFELTPIPADTGSLASTVEKLASSDERWWRAERTEKFIDSLSPIQRERLELNRLSEVTKWATAYRRTRQGKPTWEIRPDDLSGCLRTAKGGSSKQALVEVGGGDVRVRWMTAREYARLQGAPGYNFEGISEGKAQFGFGDAVCVPVIEWLGVNYLLPIIKDAPAEEVAWANVAYA